MIAILKPGTTPEQTQHLVQWLKRLDLDVQNTVRIASYGVFVL